MQVGTILAAPAFWCAVALAQASAADDGCRTAYVVPYSEQCDFDYRSIRKDASVQNVANAFAACDRAQNVAVSCVKTPDKQQHAIATAALYRDVTEQAEIALFTQHFSIAEALLHERLDVLRVLRSDGLVTASVDSHERAAVASDLADVNAGHCTAKALARGAPQASLAKAHRYRDLATLLDEKYRDYAACAPLATTTQKRAYIRYESLVALEESGRAAQAGGDAKTANQRYGDCMAGASAEFGNAAPAVRKYLGTVHDLCKARRDGRYPVDQPQPLDVAASKGFVPVAP